jgi:RNA-directed DNA polymerase
MGKLIRAVLRGRGGGNITLLPDTHYWGKSHRGKWIIKQKTARQRLSRGLKRIDEWYRRNRHQPVAEQHRELCQKIRGHYAYYGITGNGLWLKKFNQGVRRTWRKWLHRRSRTPSNMPWDRFVRLMERYPFPPIRVVHSVYAAKP